MGVIDEDEDFCFVTLRHEADALAAESAMSDMAATPTAIAESAAVRGVRSSDSNSIRTDAEAVR